VGAQREAGSWLSVILESPDFVMREFEERGVRFRHDVEELKA